jgi:hypothetical protein
MPRATKAAIWLVFGVVLVLAAGCGKGAPDPVQTLQNTELGEIYESYMHYLKSHQQPPKQLSDFKQYEKINSLGFRVLKEGKYIAVWGVSSKDAGTVLAYEKDAPTQGGVVLMADGSQRTMTAAELQAAAKIKS